MTQVAAPKKFKICLVTISLAQGGAERSCAMLSQMLDEKGHDVSIVVIKDEIDFPFAGTLFNLGKLKSRNEDLLGRMRRFKKLRKFLLREKFDVIIDHCPKNIFSREFFYDRYIYRGIPRIYVVHTSKKEFALTKRPSKMVGIYNQNIANIGVSKYIEQEILENAGVQNAVTIYNAIDQKWKNEVDDVPSEIRDLKYILSYGRIDDSIKDFSFLIDSYGHSDLWNKDVYLIIMGDGKDLVSLKTYVSNLECSDYIKFLPFMANPFPYISTARCVSLTSKYEGFPMVLIESLALGTPVVSLDIVSGPSEIVKHKENGLLVSKRSIPLFAEALNTMCLDEALYRHCKENAEASVLQFSKEEISIKWDQLLQNELR